VKSIPKQDEVLNGCESMTYLAHKKNVRS